MFRNMTNATNEKGILLSPEERVTRWAGFRREDFLGAFELLECI
jgi:hypothetical protein